jgi:hypothetical protein
MQPKFMENIDANLDSLANGTALRLEYSVGGKVVLDVTCTESLSDKHFEVRILTDAEQKLAVFGKTTVRNEVKDLVARVVGHLVSGRYRHAEVKLSPT